MSIILRRRRLGRTSCREIAANSRNGIAVVRNDSPVPEANVIFRWGCTSNVPRTEGSYVVNEASAIHWCSDKKASRLAMQEAGISVPETWEDTEAYLHDTENEMTDRQFVARPRTHHQGRNLLVFDSDQDIDVRDFSARHGNDIYISEFIPKVAEYRVYVIQGRVAAVAQKFVEDPTQHAWNVHQGGRFENVRWSEWPIRACLESIKVAALAKIDFCGVDVMLDAEGKCYVLEVNSAPSLTSPYRQQVFARCFDYIIDNGKEVIPLQHDNPDRITYRSLIHPAIRNRNEE